MPEYKRAERFLDMCGVFDFDSESCGDESEAEAENISKEDDTEK